MADAQDAIAQIFANVGCVGTLCVQDATGQAEIALKAEQPMVAASVIKVLIAVAVERAFAEGSLDPTQRVTLAAQQRTPGPVGFSLYSDDVEISLRDALVAMLTISDNVATDALLTRVGADACNALAQELGLRETVIEQDLATMINSLGQAAGFASWADMLYWGAQPHTPESAAAADAALHAAPAMQAPTANRTTARDMCALLRSIWTDLATTAEGCQRIRSLMAQQLTRNRLATGFARPISVAAKSGGLLGVYRHEVGVITYPNGQWYTAAVFTQAQQPNSGEIGINAAIGNAAARAVVALRSRT